MFAIKFLTKSREREGKRKGGGQADSEREGEEVRELY